MNPRDTSGPPQRFHNILSIYVSLSFSEKQGGKYNPNKQTKIETPLRWMPMACKLRAHLIVSVFLIKQNKIKSLASPQANRLPDQRSHSRKGHLALLGSLSPGQSSAHGRKLAFRQNLEVSLVLILDMFYFVGGKSCRQVRGLEENGPLPKESMWKTGQGSEKNQNGVKGVLGLVLS